MDILKIKISEREALKRMAHICARKECCLFDIRRKLDKFDLSVVEIDHILESLLRDNFINLERYSRLYVSDKIRFNKWGKNKIRQMLYQKQIPKEIIEYVLSEINDCSVSDILTDLLSKKMKMVKAASNYERRNKLIRFALGRGFEMDDILKCIDLISEE